MHEDYYANHNPNVALSDDGRGLYLTGVYLGTLEGKDRISTFDKDHKYSLHVRLQKELEQSSDPSKRPKRPERPKRFSMLNSPPSYPGSDERADTGYHHYAYRIAPGCYVYHSTVDWSEPFRMSDQVWFLFGSTTAFVLRKAGKTECDFAIIMPITVEGPQGRKYVLDKSAHESRRIRIF